MSAPPAPTWSPPPPSGGVISSEPDSPSSDGSSSPSAPAAGSSSIISSSSTPTPPPPARGSGGASAPPPTPPGCAACKHKRQKCSAGCILAPYFPASDPDKFRSVLRVFGVKNLLRTLREVPPPRWDACVRSVVYESRMRLADPVRGCAGAIEDLEAQLMDTAVELEVLRRRLESYRQAKRGGLRLFRTPNPSQHGRAAASPRGVTDLDAARQQPGRARGDMMHPQGPHGAAWPPAMAWLAATPPQFHAMRPQFSPVPPQLSATQPQFSAMQSQSAMRRQAATRGAAVMIRDDFGNAWANDDER
uniref:LOB domain-containing protein n=1 Tax=Setaria italica TaxID=4555 RepID=K3YEJ2_SETIT